MKRLKPLTWFIAIIGLLISIILTSSCRPETGDSDKNESVNLSDSAVHGLEAVRSVASPDVVSDGNGGAIVIYGELTVDEYQEIHVQSVNRAGETVWDRVLGKQYAFRNDQLTLISDGNGGAITYSLVSPVDEVTPPSETIFRIGAGGEIIWQAELPVNSSVEHICPDSSGNAFIAYSKSNQRGNLFIQRTGNDGTFLWDEDGVLLRRDNYQFMSSRLVPDGFGGIIVIWDELDNGSRFCGQRIDGEANLLWEGQSVIKKGKVLYTTSHVVDSQQAMMIPDGSGGILLNWIEYTADIYYVTTLNLDSSGSIEWQTQTELDKNLNAPGYVAFPFIGRDISGNIMTLWSTSDSLYAQKLDSFGKPGWSDYGIQVWHDPDTIRVSSQGTPDGTGGFFVAWGYIGNSESIQEKRLRIQKLDLEGTNLWGNKGILIETEDKIFASAGNLISDGEGGLLFAWTTGPLAPSPLGIDVFSSRDSFIQKFDSKGDPVWGPGGITLGQTVKR